MPRVFLSLAIANLICLLGAAGLGLGVAWGGSDRHVLLAVFTAILSCLLQVLVFTYFTVAGKVVVQAVHLAGLDRSPIDECKKLKRKITYALAGIFASLVLVIVTGARAWRAGEFSVTHFAAAGITIIAHVLIWTREYKLIVTQGRVMADTLERYNRWKAQRKAEAAGIGRVATPSRPGE